MKSLPFFLNISFSNPFNSSVLPFEAENSILLWDFSGFSPHLELQWIQEKSISLETIILRARLFAVYICSCNSQFCQSITSISQKKQYWPNLIRKHNQRTFSKKTRIVIRRQKPNIIFGNLANRTIYNHISSTSYKSHRLL